MKEAGSAVLEIAKKFEAMTGRSYGFIEEYRMDDAETAVIAIGSSAGTGKACVDQLREEGHKVGLIKIRVFRPFPAEELTRALANVKAVAIMDKADSFAGCGGPLFAETRSAMYDLPERPLAVNYVYGLGGRDVTVEHFRQVFCALEEIAATGQTGEVFRYIGVRDENDTKVE